MADGIDGRLLLRPRDRRMAIERCRADLVADLEPAVARRHDRVRGGRPDGALAALRVRRWPGAVPTRRSRRGDRRWRYRRATDRGVHGAGCDRGPVGRRDHGRRAPRTERRSGGRAVGRPRRDVVDDLGSGVRGDGRVRPRARDRRRCVSVDRPVRRRPLDAAATVWSTSRSARWGREPAGSRRCRSGSIVRRRARASSAGAEPWRSRRRRMRHRRSLAGRGAVARGRGRVR